MAIENVDTYDGNGMNERRKKTEENQPSEKNEYVMKWARNKLVQKAWQSGLPFPEDRYSLKQRTSRALHL